MSENNINLVPFEEKYFDQLMDFVKSDWNSNHVLVKSSKLFHWHYTGFGHQSGVRFPLLFDGDRLIGYRMMTPIEIVISDNSTCRQIISSSASSLYYVDKAYRGKKLGVKLENSVIEQYGGYITIAANPVTAVPILKRSGCKMIDTMLRWFRPLSNDLAPIAVEECGHRWNYITPTVMQPCNMDADTLSDLWNKSIIGKSIISLNRSKDFWQWRYLDDPYYKYHFFKNKSGVIVARVCSLFDEDQDVVRQKVLRILEIIPADPNVWDGHSCSELSLLLDGVCGWGLTQDCIAAEFYLSTHRFDSVMKEANFEEINTQEPLCNSIMSYFEPMCSTHRLSNVGIMSQFVPNDFDFFNSYFTLSDADQDRPNIISE